MEINMKDYEEWKEKASKEKTEISVTDLIKVCSRIASVAAEPKSKAVGMLGASMETVKIIAEFFPEKKETEEKEAEEPQEEKSTEKDAKFEDLKNLLFTHTASYRVPIPVTAVAYSHTAETRRTAKYWALLALISNAGLTEEYHEWLREHGEHGYE